MSDKIQKLIEKTLSNKALSIAIGAIVIMAIYNWFVA